MTGKIRCIAVDDEPFALSVISTFCERMGNVELSTYTDPRLGLDAIMERKPDLVLLDIEMNGLNGLDIARHVGQQAAVIFTTAYAQYALDGYDLGVVDFLHKPFAYERFVKAMEKAGRRIKLNAGADTKRSIVVKQEYDNVNVPLADILYIESMENYCKIFKDNGECIISRISLKTLLNMLPASAFVRIHRSFIVAVDRIMKFTKQDIRLSNGKLLPIGRHYATEVSAVLSNRY